jgi:hypothetical protein
MDVRIEDRVSVVDLKPAGRERMVIALGLLAGIGVSARLTMEPGRYRDLVWILSGFFAVRVVLGWVRSR